MTTVAAHEWRSMDLGALAQFRNGVNYNKDNFGDGIKIINVKDFQNHLIAPLNDLEQINPVGVVSKQSLLRDGDIVFVRSNGNRELIGRSLFLRGIHEDVTHSAFSIRCRFTSDLVLPRFYAYLFRTHLIRHILSAQGNGTNISNLNQGILENLTVPLPPLSTQKAITAVLSTYDDLIENNTRRIQILEEMAQALYREWFVHFRFPGHEQSKMVESAMGPVPERWEVAAFSEIAIIMSGGTPKTTVDAYWNGEIPFFSPKDAPTSFYVIETEKGITQDGLKKCNSRLFPKETVFITARGTVGKLALAATDMSMNQSCYALQGRTGISQHFLFLALKASVDELKQGATGAVFDTIVVDSFSRLRLAKPPAELIGKWSNLVSPIFKQLLVLIRKNESLRQTRDLLLPKLISGEVEVGELEIAGKGT